jgi:hypothetical protein
MIPTKYNRSHNHHPLYKNRYTPQIQVRGVRKYKNVKHALVNGENYQVLI